MNLFSAKNEERDKQSSECENVNKELEAKIAELKEKLSSSFLVKYEPMEKKTEDLFGKLAIKVSFNLK